MHLFENEVDLIIGDEEEKRLPGFDALMDTTMPAP
jgi:hypothetical protein